MFDLFCPVLDLFDLYLLYGCLMFDLFDLFLSRGREPPQEGRGVWGVGAPPGYTPLLKVDGGQPPNPIYF